MRIPLRIFVGELEISTNPDVFWEDMAQEWQTETANWEDTIVVSSVNENDNILDMFNDESVTIKRAVKDLSDPKKLFTDFSRTFTVPATKKNNRLFKHYYNIDIIDGLDSRKLMPCKLFLGNVLYKEGNLSVESVEMSRGKAMHYSLRFIGILSDLSKKIGSDELTSLGLEQYNIQNYSPRTEFSTGVMDTITFPLASKSKRFIINSQHANYVEQEGLENTKNIRYSTQSDHPNIYGLIDSDVVGAMRVGKILDAIESKYDLDFTGALTRNYIRDMYLWLHKADKDRDGDTLTYTVDNLSWSPSGSFTGVSLTDNAVEAGYIAYDNSYSIRAKGTWTGDGKLIVKKNGTALAEVETSNSFTQTIMLEHGSGSAGSDQGTYTFEFQYVDGAVSTVAIEVEFVANELFTFPGEVYQDITSSATYTGTQSITLGSGQYEVNKHLPQMKVIDFLTSLFKMFNIIAEPSIVYNTEARNQNYTEVFTQHFDKFMSTGQTKDFTEYIDHTKHTVSKPNLFSALKFSFSGVKTAMEQGFLKVNGRPYGELTYQMLGSDGERLIGSEYKLEIKNQRIPCERLSNLATNALTSVVYTQFGDIKGSEQTTDPKFTYIAEVSNGVGLAWDTGGHVFQIVNYCMPSNVYAGGDAPSSVLDPQEVGLYFGEELNEHAVNRSIVGLGLVNNFYRGLLSMMFDEDKRQVKMTGEVNKGQLMNLKLSDTLRIGNYFYNINSIDTNHLTGKTNFDLTLVGRDTLVHFQKLTRRISNTNGLGGADLRVTYMNRNGFIVDATIAGGSSLDIDCIGLIRSFSHDNYTDVIQ